MASIELINVDKAYGATAVVRQLSLAVVPGEMLSLLGPSGCGKTTTLRMIAGLERVDSGRLLLSGREVDGETFVPPERRGLAMVFQSYAIWPHKTVAENVAYPLRLQRTPRSELAGRVNEALGWVRMQPFAERRPHMLSGGQLQRVALARALAANPKVLLLDEPLSNLDASLREELRAEIAALRARLSTTMVYVTHDQSEALALSDRVAVMNGGRIEQLAAPERLYQEPASAFVAAFVGGANVISGEVEGATFRVEGLALRLPPGDWARGRATLAVRPEDIALSDDGTPLKLTARLFLGASAEYRFALGAHSLRAVGPPREVRAGSNVGIRILKARQFRQ